MAKIVISGRADCPYFARVEGLCDNLATNLPDFKVHKIIKKPEEWEDWLSETCKERGWIHNKSPLVWRELIDRGGKGVLIGGANEFQEYTAGYYGISSAQASLDMKKIADENMKTKIEIDIEETERKQQSQPINVCMSGASSAVSYHTIDKILAGDVFGMSTEISLHLLDDEENMDRLHGVEMEVMDLSCGLLRNILVTSNAHQAFADCRAIILLDDIDKTKCSSRHEWVKKTETHYKNYGSIINDVACKNVKVLLAGSGPLNLACQFLIEAADSIPNENFVASPRTLENAAKSIVAQKLSVKTCGVCDVVVWGNINGSHYTDIRKTRVHGYDGAIWGPPSYSTPAIEMLHDNKWIEKEFPDLVNARHETLQKTMEHAPAMSTAASIINVLQHWWGGSPKEEVFSLAVRSQGWYDVPEGTVFSFPVTNDTNGDWHVVTDMVIDEDTQEHIRNALKDIEDEKMLSECDTPPDPPSTNMEVIPEETPSANGCKTEVEEASPALENIAEESS